MAKAIFYQKGESVDYRPETAVAAGDIVVQGKLVGIARLDIPAGTLGSLAICGIFKVAKKASAVLNTGAVVYFDGTEAATAGSTVLGIAVADASANDEYVLVSLNHPAAYEA